MKSGNFIFIALFTLATFHLNSQTVLINFGANWDYYDLENEPADQGVDDWNDLNYNSSWANGNAHLGYGDGDEATAVNPNTLTCYFRHEFNVTNPGAYDNIDLDLTYDDGAVVYLNGAEVWRVNMPGGTITYSTFSSTTSSDNAQTSTNITNGLVTGHNVLAVEIHQRSSSSSDISFDFKLTANSPGAVNVDRGPYLQKASPTSVTVKWRTASATESIIDYGTSQGNLNLSASDLTPKTEHELELSGLSANTIYYYEISNSLTVLVPAASDLYFKTHPTSGTSQASTFWVLGDCGTANNDARTVRDAYYGYIGSNHTDGIIFLGDNAYNDGTDNEYQFALFENMYEDKLKNSISWSCLGNHDGHSADSDSQTGPYYDIFSFPTNAESGGVASGTEAYYSFDHGNIHFIILDSYETDRSVGGSMYNWCENDVQNTTADWIVAVWHHPAYTKGSHNSDNESNLVQMRQNFNPLLENNGVDLILSGHSHSYERSYFLNGHYGTSGTFNINTHTVGATGDGDGQPNGNGAYVKDLTGPGSLDGAVYITAGSSGKISGGSLNHPAMYASLNNLGSCVVETDGNIMNVKFIRETGAIIDSFTIDKTPACIPGNPCDDLDACTINDVYDANCDCAGTFEDTDGDGVCDANDQCPGTDDSIIGTSCDDLDNCTTGDVFDNACNCVGTFQDADSDGVCDADDQCPGTDDALIGTPCDDLDDCTTGDIYDNSCNCAGTFQDADGDGICDANDQCPGTDDAIIGTSCDDLDDCTTGDVYDNACNCAGTLVDADGDGFCIGDDPDDGDPCNPDSNSPACDPCSDFISDGFESGFGNWNDGGSDCARTTSNPNTGSYSIRIRDNTGSSSSLISDILDLSLFVEAEISFSYFPVGMESNEDFFLEISTNGGSNYSIFQEWNSGVEFSNNNRYNETVMITGFTFTSNTVFRFRCDASGNNDHIYLDDIVIRGCSINCSPGANCDDGDDCTTGDVYDSNCNCAGIFQDADGDGVCDANDQCPGTDDSIIGTSCNDLDACTLNDVYDNTCNCTGIYTDADGDGFCVGDDPDDNDGCNPDPNSPACNSCDPISTDGFESGFGNWNDGGGDCTRVTFNPNTGSYSIRIRDNSGSSSSMFTDAFDLSSYDEVNLNFSFYPESMEIGEDFFLEYSTNDGSNYTLQQTWTSGADFQNGVRVDVSVSLVGIGFTNVTRFRFRCDASNNGDKIYIDDVVIEACNSGSSSRRISDHDNQLPQITEPIDLIVYPNPTDGPINIDLSQISGLAAKVQMYSFDGQLINTYDIANNHEDIVPLDLGRLSNGLYLIKVLSPEQQYNIKRIVFLNR
jgi:hypothetical protein